MSLSIIHSDITVQLSVHHSSVVSPCHIPSVQSHITVQPSVHFTLHLYSHTSQFSCQSMSLSICTVTHHSSAVSPFHSPSIQSHITVQLSVHVTLHLYSLKSQSNCHFISLSTCTVSSQFSYQSMSLHITVHSSSTCHFPFVQFYTSQYSCLSTLVLVCTVMSFHSC